MEAEMLDPIVTGNEAPPESMFAPNTPPPAVTTTGDPTGPETGKTFTQAEVSALIAKELRPFKTKAKEGEAAQAKLAELTEQAKTDQEKAIEKARAEGAAEKETAIFAARAEGRILSNMTRHQIPEDMLDSFRAQLGEIESLEGVAAAVDALVSEKPGVWGVFAKSPAPAVQGGAPSHPGPDGWGGNITRTQIQEKIMRAGGQLDREAIAKMNQAHKEGRIIEG